VAADQSREATGSKKSQAKVSDLEAALDVELTLVFLWKVGRKYFVYRICPNGYLFAFTGHLSNAASLFLTLYNTFPIEISIVLIRFKLVTYNWLLSELK
jgi:hypothetical protein